MLVFDLSESGNKCGVGHCDVTDTVKGGNRLQLTSKFTPNLDKHTNRL